MSIKMKGLILIIIFSFAIANVMLAKGKKGLKKIPSVIQMDDMKIEGKIVKPEVFYILSRTETHYKLPINKESFIKRIEKSVDNNPF